MVQNLLKGNKRTSEQLREHYEIEKELASRLRNASRQDRLYLYSSLYEEMYKRVPLHPQLIQKTAPQQTKMAVSRQMKFLKPFLRKDITFLEVGSGDCALSFEVARFVRQVYAVDVSNEITKSIKLPPPNYHLVLSNGISIPLPRSSVNIAYSNQLMEHLHPDDALEQLENIYNVLILGGIYICITPNRLNGPHDISQFYDKVATGFHLKEYTTLELSSLFNKVGFSWVKAYIGAKGIYIILPTFPISLCETLLSKIPYTFRKTIARTLPVRLLLGIRLVGKK